MFILAFLVSSLQYRSVAIGQVGKVVRQLLVIYRCSACQLVTELRDAVNAWERSRCPAIAHNECWPFYNQSIQRIKSNFFFA